MNAGLFSGFNGCSKHTSRCLPILMSADGAHDSFPCAETGLLCRVRCCEDRLRLKQMLTDSDQLFGKTQERARLVKARLYATLIWLVDYVLSLLFSRRTFRHYEMCYGLGRCCRLAHVQPSVRPRQNRIRAFSVELSSVLHFRSSRVVTAPCHSRLTTDAP